MKNKYFRLPQITALKSILGFALLILSLNFNIKAQQLPECASDVPFFILDISSTPDSIYTTPEIVRDGQCCGGAGNENYVSFYVTLNPNVAAVEIGILPGYADPGGSGFYGVISGGDLITPGICGAETAGGEPTCIVGPGPHKITYHKPGKNKVKYYLKQIPQPIYPADDTTRVGCSLPLDIFGLNDIVITSINSSTGNTTPGAYNGLLSCTDCDNPSFNPGLGTPAWIDYQICGTQQASLVCGVFATCDTIRLYTLSRLQLSVTPNPAQFCDGDSVLLTASALGGDGNYSFQWFDSDNNVVSSTNSYYASVQGDYTAQCEDGLITSTCPAEFEAVVVTIGLLPEADAGLDQTACASSPQTLLSGSVLNATGGTWSGGAGTYDPSANSLILIYTPTNAEITAGSVDMILTTSNSGCPNDSDTMTIFFSDTVFTNPTFPSIICNGDMTTISAGASGGTVPYSYSWSTGSSNPSILVSAGTYSVTVYDLYGCSADAVINVIEPSPIFLNMSSTNTSTDIACDGTASVVISGGDAPYSVLWSNAEITLTASNLCYGIATVDVTDSNGCLVTGSVVVNNPSCASFDVTASKTDLACYGDTTGTASAIAVGGTPGYSYSWNCFPVQTTAIAVNLDAGTYTVTATDTNGCIDVASVTILQPTVLTNTMTSTDVTTIGGSDGTATANTAGGFPGYSYVWSPTPQFTQTAINLTAGIYYVDITDANSCAKSDSIYINEPPCNDFLVSVNPSPITCNGDDDGSAYIIIAYGTPPFSITWSSGETDVMSVSNLAPGSYSVTIIDSSNCTTFKNFDITEPDVLSLGLAPTNVSCFGAADGTIDLTVSGGNFPYTYDWTVGAVTIATHQDIVNLAPGTYSIEVTDENGCIAEGSTGITQPAQLMASFTYQDITCNGDDNGSINVTVSGGTLPYSYSWTGPNGYNNNTQDISNLEAGLYQLQITDGNGCMLGASIQAFINEPDSVIIETFTIPCPVPGGDFVTVTINSISGGAGGNYQVSFDGGSTYLAAGVYSALLPIDSTYFVVAIDSNGCNSPDTLELTIDPKVEITAVVFDPCVAEGTTEINITVSPQGGDGGPYEVSTDGGSTFNAAGTYVLLLPVDDSYDIVLRDGKGCESLPWPIVLPAPYTDTIVQLSEVSCDGAADGSVDLTITGGTSPYSIAWTGPSGFNSTDEDLSALVAGTYYVTITDDSNCVIIDSIDVTTTPDNTPPVITFCPGNQNESSDLGLCSHTHSGTAWDATATDDCVVASLEYSLSGATIGTGTSLNGVIFNLGTTTVTWSATDGSGNTDQCSFDVTIADDEDPSISSCGAAGTQNVDSDPGVCSYTHSGTAWNATATDNCTVSTISYSLSGATSGSGTSLNGVVFNLGTTTVTWTVTDGSGNISTCNFDVIVSDDQLPAITSCGAAGTQNVDSNPGVCTYTHSGTAWNATATDNCTVSTISYSLSGATSGSGTSLNGVVFNLGTTTVTWTVTDGSGNISTCNFDVIVSDNQLPAIVSCGASGNQNVIANFGTCTYTNSGNGWNASATDNCTVSSIVYTLTGATSGSGTSLNGVVFNLGTTSVTWTVTDNSGNISTCNFDVIVTDNQVPSIISCGASGNQNVITAPGVCSYTHPSNSWNATAMDNCSVGSIAYVLTGATTGSGTSLNGVTFNLGVTTVTWTVTDGSGNTSSCAFNVTVTDNQSPVIISCGATGTQNVVADGGVCTHTHPNTSWDATATDNCTVSSVAYTLSGATSGSGTSLSGVAFNLGTTTVTWIVTDGSGNTASCSFNVVVTDTQPPVIISCGAGNQNVNSAPGVCNYTNSGTAWNASASDNCTLSSLIYTLSGATTGSGTSLNGVVFNLGTTTVTWTATDGSGNIATCNFSVTVTDNQLPAIISCGAVGNQNVVANPGVCSYTHSGTAWNATATDNCTVSSVAYTLTGATTGSGTSLNGASFNLGTTTVTWTASDGSGNISTCTFDVIVTDNQSPAITSCGPSGTQTVNANSGTCTFTFAGTGWNASATDNCSVSSLIYTLSGATTGSGTSLNGVAFNLGTTTVTWTVTDGSGNTSFCTFNVVVIDDQSPAITSCGAVGTQNVNTNPGVCSYTQIGTAWNATAVDNCTVSTISYNLTGATTGSGTSLAGVTFNQGTTLVTWTVVDGSGNSVTCNFSVIVTDNEDPAIVNCVSNIVVNNDPGICGAIVTWTPPTFTDNCGGSMTSTHNPGDFFTVGTTQVTYTATDGSGNVSTCIFNVTVTDNALPQLTCSANISSCDPIVTFTTPNATDNCGVVSVIQTAGLPSGSFFPVGTTVVTFEALDVNGNTNTCSFNVTINPTPVLSTIDTDVSCYLAADGSIGLTVTGGTGPFSYSWSNGAITEDVFNLVPGIYTVVVSDVFGCSATISDTITQPNLLVLSKEVTHLSCFGANDGAIDLTISGGTLPYSYVWSNGATMEDLTGLTAGTYSVVVTDANGCQVFSTSTITQPSEIIITGIVTDGTCGAANGSIQVLVTGGTTPYQYLWSNGTTNLNLTNVVAGMYSLTVTDDNGCTAVFTDSVGSSANLSAHLHLEDVSCYGAGDGSALVEVDSGNQPYTYEWSTTSVDGNVTNFNDSLIFGDYWVTITDAFGCQVTLDFTINQPDSLFIVLESIVLPGGFNVSENGASDGWITCMVYGGTQEYYYQWSTGASSPELFNLPAGSYQITVVDKNGCPATNVIRLIEPDPLQMPEGLSPNGDGDNDFFVILGLEAYPNNNLTIYNRWGNIIFNQDGYNNDWQGTNENGEELPDGTYFAILTVDGEDPLTGYVDLRRSR